MSSPLLSTHGGATREPVSVRRPQDRILYIDVFRAVAIMLVTGFHLWRDLGKPSLPGAGSFKNFDALGFFFNGVVGVELFFFISGFCLALGGVAKRGASGDMRGNYLRYLFARFMRVAPPYYVAIIVWNLAIRYFGVAIKPVTAYHNLMHVLFVHNLTRATFFSVSGVFWSLAVEMQFYLLLPIILPLLRKHTWLVLAATAALSIVISRFGTDVVSLWSVFSYLPVFLAGSACGLQRERVCAVLAKPQVAIVIVGSALALLSYTGEPFLWGTLQRIVCGLLLGLSMVACANAIEQRRGRFLSGMAFVGRISFSVYLYNYAFTAFRTDHSPLSWLGLSSFLLGLGLVMYFLVEEPALRLRVRLLRRRAALRADSTPSEHHRTT